MSKLINILEGWGRYITGQIPQYAIDRAKVCGTCDHIQESTFEMILKDNTLKEVEGQVCGVCSCPIITKVRARHSECPLNKWRIPST